ncbi:hypothetical protein [Pseudarthrobacter sp. BRE9]|uniref:hypothetical protein n=1 Tax=Pseudarthrobacter sp. BRE9 TaxID=2962582 RepID=UPI002881D201|nr:hypothetical protein [Pseudarthrobacter sp. BRE9]MDT0171015.1 hypothetical protein [Pseudarthrobacter sp. BRE9]
MGETQTTPEGESQLRDISARRRVMIGRNITLSAGILYALTRSIYYSTVRPESLSGAQAVITADGHLLGFWGAAWGMVATLCIADMVNRHTRHGLSLLVGIAGVWGVSYLIIWGVTRFTDFSLVSSAIGWLGPAAFILGFLLKVTALQDMLRAVTPAGRPRDND